MAPPFIRPTVRDMDGYTPGEQPRVGERIVKLNTNENPFPPSDKVMAALRNLEGETLRRYPNPTADPFRAAAAKLHGITPDMILCGNGSDDILTIATRTFLSPAVRAALANPPVTASSQKKGRRSATPVKQPIPMTRTPMGAVQSGLSRK